MIKSNTYLLKKNNVSDIHYYDYMNIGGDDLLIEKKVNIQNTEDVDVNKILISEEKLGKNGKKKDSKYFIGYKNDGSILHQVPKNQWICRQLERTWIHVLFNQKQSTGKKYLTSSYLMGTEFDSQPKYDRKYLKTKLKRYGDVIPKEGFHWLCLSIIVIELFTW